MKLICFASLIKMVELCYGTNTIAMSWFTKYQTNDVKLNSHITVTSVTTSTQCVLTCTLTSDCYRVSYNTQNDVDNCELAGDILINDSTIPADGWTIFYTQGPCPYGWTTSENSCYKLEPVESTFETSKQLCESYPNSHLIDISSLEEQNLMKDIVIAHYSPHAIPNIWCGLTDINIEGTFQWSDGSILETNGYEAWAPSQPQKANIAEGCVSIFSQDDFQWHDDFCGYDRISICEIDIN